MTTVRDLDGLLWRGRRIAGPRKGFWLVRADEFWTNLGWIGTLNPANVMGTLAADPDSHIAGEAS